MRDTDVIVVDVDPELTLWASVIRQAARDALAGDEIAEAWLREMVPGQVFKKLVVDQPRRRPSIYDGGWQLYRRWVREGKPDP